MKSKQPPASFLVPRAIGRSEADMVAGGHAVQLDLFRETLTRRAKVQVLAMMALSDPKRLDRSQHAKIADILRAMGYAQDVRADGKSAFPTWAYKEVEETGLKLRRKSFPLLVREPAGSTSTGRRKYRVKLVDLSILQDFGFYYEDKEGQPIDLGEIPKEELIKIDAQAGPPLYAIPIADAKGKPIKNKDGTPRRQMATGVTWTFSSKIARLAEDKETAWVFYSDAICILRRYLNKPASFDLIFKTLFWKEGLIEMSHEKMVAHLGIRAKDQRQVEAAIQAAFADALNEGIIDKPVTAREKGYYQPTPKTNRPRRVDRVYQWKCAPKWQPAKKLIAFADDGMEKVYRLVGKGL